MESEYVTVKEAAEILGMVKSTVYRRIETRRLTAISMLGVRLEGAHHNIRLLLLRSEVSRLAEALSTEVHDGPWHSLSSAAAYLGITVCAVKKHLLRRHFKSAQWRQIPADQRIWNDRMARTYIHESELERFVASRYEQLVNQPAGEFSEFDLGYLAAMIDGEGCIILAPDRYKSRCFYSPVVSIANTDRGMLEWLEQTFGGYITLRSRGSDRWKQGWDWRTSSSGCYQLLRLIAPRLKIKRPQAELVIDFYSRMLSRSRHRPVSDEEQVWRDSVAAALHELNRKGPKPLAGLNSEGEQV